MYNNFGRHGGDESEWVVIPESENETYVLNIPDAASRQDWQDGQWPEEYGQQRQRSPRRKAPVGLIAGVAVAAVLVGAAAWVLVAGIGKNESAAGAGRPVFSAPAEEDVGTGVFDKPFGAPVGEPFVDPTAAPVPVVMPEIEVGDIITFGSYEQDGRDSAQEVIEWYVLDKSGEDYLLVSRYCLDAYPYESSGEKVSWADSDLREWLNSVFYLNAFDAQEQELVLSTELYNEDNPKYDTDGGTATTDKVFILSYSEAIRYYTELSCQASSTGYAIQRGAFQRDTSGYGWYWLRTPGEYRSRAMYISSGGDYVTSGVAVSDSAGCVRPCVWIDGSGYESGMTTIRKVTDVPMETANVGDVVLFGSYEQDGILGSEEEIEWIVLARQSNSLLLLSRYSLDAQPFHTNGNSVTWENSWIREWLNNEFIYNAFSSGELSRIQYTACYNDQNPVHGTGSGNATTDRVFLLSVHEANMYLTTLHAAPTKHAVSQGGLFNEESRNTWWWLRTAGERSDMACYISSGGYYEYLGVEVERSDGGVRPAIWVTID